MARNFHFEPKKEQSNNRLHHRAYDDSIVAVAAADAFHDTRRKSKMTKNELFLCEFAQEIDLFPLQESFPEWVYDYRDAILRKLRGDFRVLCRKLRESGISFFAKYPIEIEGKWKFADVFIPESRLVVLLLNESELIGLPCHSFTERERWFRREYKTLGVCSFELYRVMDRVKSAISCC